MKIESKPTLAPHPASLSVATDLVWDQDERATPERLTKGQEFLISSRTQHVLAPLASLRRAGDIEDCHVSAADRWYRDYVLGVIGARDPEAVTTGKAPDPHARMLARVAACHRYRSVRDALGMCGEIRLQLLLIEELSFSAIALRLMPGDGNGRKKIAAQMILLLEQLTEYYEKLDCRKAPPGRAGKLQITE